MLKIRLRRMGSRHKPFYRVVVSDSRRTPTASSLEEVGYYDPRQEPSVVQVDAERVEYWQGRGAQLSSSVKKLLKAKPVSVEDLKAAPKAEEPKAEKPKAEEPKAEAKAEEPKAEEPKAEEPKAEEPKAEAGAEAPAEAEASAETPAEAEAAEDKEAAKDNKDESA